MKIKLSNIYKNDNILLFSLISIFLIVFYVINNCYPFGNNLLMLNDDGYQQHYPLLYYYWDAIHGKRSFLFDWDFAYGSNMMGILSHFGLLSPINLLYFFIPRNFVIYASNFLFILRILLLGFSFKYYLNKTFSSLHRSLVLVFSLLYCLNTYVFHYIYFTQWIDIAILLPLCIVFLNDMINDGLNCYKYTLSLLIILIINMQQSYCILVFIIIYSGLSIISSRKNNVKVAILRLGFYTILSLLLSCVVLLPAAYQITSSARLQGNVIYKIKEIFRSNANPDQTYYKEKLLLLRTAYIPLLLNIPAFINRRKIKQNVKEFIFYCSLSVLMILPIFIESINIAWQGGNYVCFPFRCGYLMYFSVISLSAFCYDGYIPSKANAGFKKYKLFICAFFVILLSILLVLNNRVVDYNSLPSKSDATSDIQDNYSYNPLVREKDTDSGDNNALISSIPSVKSYLHLFPAEIINVNKYLGYSQVYTRLSNLGGTQISDLVSNFNQLWFYYCQNDDQEFTNDLFKNQNIITNTFWNTDMFTEYILDDSEHSITIPLENESIIYSYNPDDDITFIHDMGTFYNEYTYIRQENEKGAIHIGVFDSKLFSDNLDKSEVEKLDYTNRSISFSVTNDQNIDRVLFVPIANLMGWSVSINNKKVDTTSVFNAFIGISIPANETVYIKMIYTPPFLYIGLLFSFIGLLILLIDYKFRLCNKIKNNILLNLIFYSFCIVFLVAIGLIYILNILFYLVDSKYWYPLLQKRF